MKKHRFGDPLYSYKELSVENTELHVQYVQTLIWFQLILWAPNLKKNKKLQSLIKYHLENICSEIFLVTKANISKTGVKKREKKSGADQVSWRS